MKMTALDVSPLVEGKPWWSSAVSVEAVEAAARNPVEVRKQARQTAKRKEARREKAEAVRNWEAVARSRKSTPATRLVARIESGAIAVGTVFEAADLVTLGVFPGGVQSVPDLAYAMRTTKWRLRLVTVPRPGHKAQWKLLDR